jgi:putative ABC transport system ATP-binding protein
MDIAIGADALEKTYGRGESEVRALRGVSLRVRRGEVVALLGPSGSGKSTLLTALGLLNVAERGSIYLDGEPVVVDGVARRDLAQLRRSRLGFVFQKSNLVPFLTASENVLLALEINDVRGKESTRRARGLLEYLGLEHRVDAYPDQLSGGQQQRVAIARALAMEPPVILADEPTAALDGARSRDVMQLFRRVSHEKGAAVVVVTHDHRTLDAFDAIYEMEDGVLAPRARASAGQAS